MTVASDSPPTGSAATCVSADCTAGLVHGLKMRSLCAQVEKHGGMPTDGVLVNGDSGNDVELFAVPGVKGTMVANAHPELREWCEAHASDNIFQAREPLPIWLQGVHHDR